jgi:hypothetical protein
VIDYPVLPMQVGCHAPIAVAWKLQHNLLNRITQRNVRLSLGGHLAALIHPGATDAEQLAELTERQAGKFLLQTAHELVPGLDVTRCKAFFKAAFSTAN